MSMKLGKHRAFEIIHLHARGGKGLFARYYPFLADLFLVLLFLICTTGFIAYGKEFFSAYHEKADIQLSWHHLPKYAFFSLTRALFAYSLSLLFSLAWGFWAAKDTLAEKTLITLLDVLQSIPILGFMPGLVLFFLSLFHKTNIGLECAAIILMFTSQAWNMAFGVYQAIRTMPSEKEECATAYGFTSWQRIRYVELPFATTTLVFNSIMSVAGSWFFLMITEAFQLGNHDFRIPGLGSYMSFAAAQGDFFAIFSALMTMMLLIITIDQLVWRPLVVWSQKFRVEENASLFTSHSWFLQLLRRSLMISWIKKWIRKSHGEMHPHRRYPLAGIILSRTLLFILYLLLIWALVAVIKLLTAVPFSYWPHLCKMLLLTLSRVFACLCVSTMVALPLGLWIGLSERAFAICQPIIQIAASFPISLLFPLLILLLTHFHIPLGIDATILMLMGTGWYLLFNVIAGARAMPSDLKEAARSFSFTKRQRFLWLHLPAIFPYLVTGLVTAAGGAWNTSIIAEYLSFQGQVFITPGIGSSISMAAQNADIPLLVASVLTLVVVVALINYLGWLKLYKYSENHFSLNY